MAHSARVPRLWAQKPHAGFEAGHFRGPGYDGAMEPRTTQNTRKGGARVHREGGRRTADSLTGVEKPDTPIVRKPPGRADQVEAQHAPQMEGMVTY